MAKLIESHNKIMGSLRKEVKQIKDNLSSSFRLTASSLGSDHTRSLKEHHDDEDELQYWAAIEKLQNQRQESQDEISVVYGNQKNLPSGSKEHEQGKTVKTCNAIKLESTLETHAFIDKLLFLSRWTLQPPHCAVICWLIDQNRHGANDQKLLEKQHWSAHFLQENQGKSKRIALSRTRFRGTILFYTFSTK